GTTNLAHTGVLAGALGRATRKGVVVVSARESEGASWLPGSLDGAAGVLVDWDCDRDEMDVSAGGALPVFRASAYPRPIPGVARERNLSGISFAVANVTGFLARALEAGADPRGLAGRDAPKHLK